MSYPVGNPDERFSHGETHKIISFISCMSAIGH